MREAFAKRKFPWAAITGQELTDILVYLQNLPETKDLPHHFDFPPTGEGEKLFQSKGCVACHSGATAPETLPAESDSTDIAVDMWHHQPEMKQPRPTLSPEEMRQIIGYLWARQYFTGSGNAERGKKVFSREELRHLPQRPLERRSQAGQGEGRISDITMVAALWEHGPRMLDLMKSKNIAVAAVHGAADGAT